MVPPACSWHRRPTGRQRVPAWPDVPQKDRVWFTAVRACVYVCVCVRLCVFKWMAGLSLKSWRPAASTSQMVPETHIHKCTEPATRIQSASATPAAANPQAACWRRRRRRGRGWKRACLSEAATCLGFRDLTKLLVFLLCFFLFANALCHFQPRCSSTTCLQMRHAESSLAPASSHFWNLVSVY